MKFLSKLQMVICSNVILIAILFSLVVFDLGCDQIMMDDKAVISEVDYDRAWEVVLNTQSYLPYWYTPDGCYARALYMAMELALEDIASSSLFIFGNLDYGTGTWGWHVAPLVATQYPLVSDNIELAMVLDPALTLNGNPGPFTLLEWAQSSDQADDDGQPVEYNLHYGWVYFNEVLWTLRRTAVTAENIADLSENMIEGFENFGEFSVSAVEHACDTMYRYAGRDSDPDQTEQVRQELLARTDELIIELYSKGKLDCDGYSSSPSITSLCDFSSFCSGDICYEDMGGYLSGVSEAPLHCGNGVPDGNETGTDCGGSCPSCDQISDAAAAVMIKNYYDWESSWAGTYVMGAIYNLVWEDNVAHVHYGYARPETPEDIEGQDSRTFTFEICSDQSSMISAMGSHLSGEARAPRSCRNGLQDDDESGVDCGGNCTACGSLNEAEAAIVIRQHYDNHGEFAGTYVIGAIYNLQTVGKVAYVHYGYARPDDVQNILGRDSRTFQPCW